MWEWLLLLTIKSDDGHVSSRFLVPLSHTEEWNQLRKINWQWFYRKNIGRSIIRSSKRTLKAEEKEEMGQKERLKKNSVAC